MTSLPIEIFIHWKAKMTKKDLTMGGSVLTHKGIGGVYGGWGCVNKWWSKRGHLYNTHNNNSFLSPQKQTHRQIQRRRASVREDVRCPTCVPFKGLQIGPKQRPLEIICIWKSLPCCGRGCVLGWFWVWNKQQAWICGLRTQDFASEISEFSEKPTYKIHYLSSFPVDSH